MIPGESLQKKIYKLRTIDIWDTVLRRKCHPDAVKLETGRKLIIRHGEYLSPVYRDSWALLDLRCRIEGELARAAAADPSQDDEYSLKDVLQIWVARALLPNTPDHAQIIDGLAADELEQEVFVCYADTGILDQILNYEAEKTLFLSDFYMPAKSLHALLEAKGVTKLFDGGHSSCDHKLNKRSGRFFKLVHDLYKIDPQDHFHIGDNVVSDYESPKRLGIHAVHYVFRQEEDLREQKKKIFYDREALYRAIDSECGALLLEKPQGHVKEAFEYGVKLASLLIGFALFIVESVQRDKAGKLFFFTREGEFFISVYEALREASPGVVQSTPKGTVLDVSRLATFAASLRDFSIEEMMRLWNLYSTQSMRVWEQSLGMEPNLVAAWYLKYGILPEQPIQYPWQNKQVGDLFRDAGFIETLKRFVENKRTLLSEYLETKDLRRGDTSVAIVDIGWRGTIQDNIALLMPETRFSGYYLGLQKFLNSQPANCTKAAFGPDLNISSDDSRLFGNLSLIEMLTNSPHGSTIGYDKTPDGRTVSIRLKNSAEDQTFHDYVSHIQDGVLHATRIWAPHIHAYAISSIEMRERGMKLWSQLISKPPRIVQEAHSKLQHNELFGLGSFVQKRKSRLSFIGRLFSSNSGK